MRNIFHFLRSIFCRGDSAQVATTQPAIPQNNSLPLFDSYGEITKSGVSSIAHYYNLKYPERGEIIPRFLTETEVTKEEIDSLKAITRPAKIMLVSISRAGDPYHCHPFILTTDKLISLRGDGLGKIFYRDLASMLDVPLITPKDVGTFQNDSTSCYMIAAGILKDLTTDDVKKISGFQNEYTPLAKSLKYCQNTYYLDRILTKEIADQPVKKSKETARQYFEKYAKVDGGGHSFNERISQKAYDLETLMKAHEPSSTTAAEVAQKILEEKSKKNPPRK